MWLKHFSSAVRPSQANKVLLILDGHCSHTRSIEAIEYAREHGIVMLSLPPHTTHKLQPLDVSFFKPLQTFYAQQQEAWLRANPGRQITAHQICSLFNSANVRAASTATAVNGFAETGIWPCNRSVFTEADFTSTCSPEDTFSSTQNKLLSTKNKTKKNNDSKSNKQHKKAKGKKTKKRATARSSNSEDAAWYCFMCRECSPEDMIQCFHCLRWAHEECAGTQTNNTAYQCDTCQRK